ncbi:MAG: glycosyltransferase family 8 protein [Bacteroidales bacterium]
MEINSEKTGICTVTSSEFVPGTLVLIQSFLNHNPWFDGDIVIISDGLEPGQVDLFEIFPKVVFHRPGEDLLLQIGHLCNALPGIIPRRKRFYSIEVFNLEGYDRLFFFDSDMLVMGDISELLSYQELLLACSDQPNRHAGKVRDRSTFKRISADGIGQREVLRRTFNAGFMVPGKPLLNQHTYEGLKKLIHMDTFREVRTHNTDQVVLNLLFDGKVRFLDFTYNMIVSKWSEFSATQKIDPADVKILHFTGSYKPWETGVKMNGLNDDPVIKAFYDAWFAENDEVTAKISRKNSSRRFAQI